MRSHRVQLVQLSSTSCHDVPFPDESSGLAYTKGSLAGAGEFNVPFGSYKRIGYRHDFSDYREAFHDWKFTIGDFEDLRLTRDDFVYADPPYDVELWVAKS